MGHCAILLLDVPPSVNTDSHLMTALMSGLRAGSVTRMKPTRSHMAELRRAEDGISYLKGVDRRV